MVTHRIHRRTLALIAGLSLLGSLLMLLGAELYTRHKLEPFLRESAQTVAQQTAARIAQYALANDTLAISMLLNRLVEDPNIHDARYYGMDQRLIAAAGHQDLASAIAEEGKHLVVLHPVTYDNVLAGQLRLSWNRSAFSVYRRELRLGLGALAFSALLVALFAGHRLGARLARQSAQIRDSLENLGTLPPAQSGEKARDDELTQLSHEITTLEADHRRKLTGVSGAQAIGGAPDLPEPTAVLVMEPTGLHALLAQFEAEQINGILRRAYELVRRSASLYQASHCLIENNRVLVLFSGGSDDEPECFRAVCAGRLIQQLLARVREERTAGHGPSVHFRCLVHAGRMIVPDHLESEVHLAELDGHEGAVVRMAARMLAYAKADELLVSEAALNHPTVLEKAHMGEARRARTRESERPLQLFSVTALAPGYEILQERQGENLLYTASSY